MYTRFSQSLFVCSNFENLPTGIHLDSRIQEAKKNYHRMGNGRGIGIDEPEFGYVILSIAVSWLMNFFLVLNVVKARKKYKVSYPALYATKDHKLSAGDMNTFNCIQRAHQNTLESWAPMTILCVINGFYTPVYSSLFMITYSIGRVVYGTGYGSSGPDGRKFGGMITHLGDMPQLILAFYNGLSLAGFLG